MFKTRQITFNHGKTVNIYTVYDLKSSLNNSDPNLQNCLFGAVKLTKNNDININTVDLELDLIRNVIIFGADMSSFARANNKIKSVLILGEGFAQG